MKFSTAIVLVLCGLNLFLVLALAGALRERALLLRRLSRQTLPPVVDRWRHGKTFLLISEGCPACAEAITELEATTDKPEVVVIGTHDRDEGAITSSAGYEKDVELWAQLYPGFAPALVTVSATGLVERSEPVGSREAMRINLLALRERLPQ